MMPRPAALRIFWASAAATLLLGLLFWFVPGIDLATSRLFGDLGGFPLADSSFWQTIRGALRLLTDGTAIAALILAVLAYTWRNLTPLRPKTLDFWFFAYILIPGLLVNWIFQATSGRARPRDIGEFGGDATFTQAFLWADQCSRNCSFVSGEASAMAAFGTLATLLFWRYLRRIHLILLWALCLFGAVLRVSFGGHFLSDVLIAMTITSGLISLGYLLLRHYRLPGPFLNRG
jgi:lipid A 4'-phosphatase